MGVDSIMGTAQRCLSEEPARQGYKPDDPKDAIAPPLERIRSIPHVSAAVSDLLARYDEQWQHEVVPGKPHSVRKKSGRYNTTETVIGRLEVRWPNEGFIASSNAHKPPYDELTLPRWAARQLNNALLIQDNTLCQVLMQVTLALQDAAVLPWTAVRSAWATSMTEIEEGMLTWSNTTQWALNRIGASQVAVLNAQALGGNVLRNRICKYYNEGTCTQENHHGNYRHICSFCNRQGQSMNHPEVKLNIAYKWLRLYTIRPFQITEWLEFPFNLD